MKLPEVDSPPQTFLLNKYKVSSHAERTEEWKTHLLMIRTLTQIKRLVPSSFYPGIIHLF